MAPKGIRLDVSEWKKVDSHLVKADYLIAQVLSLVLLPWSDGCVYRVVEVGLTDLAEKNIIVKFDRDTC